MLDFIYAVIAFLIARCLWDYTKHRAAACNELPIVWLLKTGSMLALLVSILATGVAAILYLVTRN